MPWFKVLGNPGIPFPPFVFGVAPDVVDCARDDKFHIDSAAMCESSDDWYTAWNEDIDGWTFS